MRKGMIALLAFSASANSFAASQHMVWGESQKALPELKQESPFTQRGFAKTLVNKEQNDYALQLIRSQKNSAQHVRYQLTFRNIPVFGYQMVFHKQSGAKPQVTGINVTDIEKDVSSLSGKLTAKEAEDKILETVKEPIKFKKNQKVIYIDAQKKAHLAYHVSFYINHEKAPISAPNYLLDANTGEILKEWNEARHERIGQGLGGNAFPLPYRPGMFQHGDALPGLPSLGKFDVQLANGKCYVQNNDVQVINLENYPLGYEAFPITVQDETKTEIEAFSYPCSADSFYLNYADGHTGPINYSFSPVNDTMYFAQKTIEMYGELYGIEKPLGDDLPLRAYTHLGYMDNAFAIPTIFEENGELLAHQQIVIGNGLMMLTAPAQSVLAHELSHNFTGLNSGLLYDGQMGGINEAFSDMAAFALQDYLRKEFPWYWDGQDWSLGREATIGGQPLRYMDDPTKDGHSIGHADDYHNELDVHFSSGVYNKAFYLLATKTDWGVQKAFQVMVDANRNYWSPLAYYDFAACGVIQAAKDRKYNTADVVAAFAEVGVRCPIDRT